MLHKIYFVYILTNKYKNVFYTGVTSNLQIRTWQHKTKYFDGFSNEYNLDRLVYYEIFEDINYAIKREKRLKKWYKEWKIDIINKFNPT